MPTKYLNNLANSVTSNVGAGNYTFIYNDDEIDMDVHGGTKLIDLLELNEENKPVFSIDCFEKKAGLFTKGILIKNASQYHLWARVQHQNLGNGEVIGEIKPHMKTKVVLNKLSVYFSNNFSFHILD